MKIETKQTKNYTIELTEQEAFALYIVLSRVGGSQNQGVRSFVQPIYNYFDKDFSVGKYNQELEPYLDNGKKEQNCVFFNTMEPQPR